MLLLLAASLAVFVYGTVASISQGIGLVIASVSAGRLLDRKENKGGLLLSLGLVNAAALFVLATRPAMAQRLSAWPSWGSEAASPCCFAAPWRGAAFRNVVLGDAK